MERGEVLLINKCTGRALVRNSTGHVVVDIHDGNVSVGDEVDGDMDGLGTITWNNLSQANALRVHVVGYSLVFETALCVLRLG